MFFVEYLLKFKGLFKSCVCFLEYVKGYYIRFKCYVIGVVFLNVMWVKNNKFLSCIYWLYLKVKGWVLGFKVLINDDVGIYFCIV